MKKITFLCILCVFFFGCISTKSIPKWTSTSFNNLEDFKINYLAGQENKAEMYFQKATEAIKKSGNLRLLSMAYLTKYAMQVAVLEDFDDSQYLRIDVVDSDPRNNNYYLFLKGKVSLLNDDALPKQYRPLLKVMRMGNEATLSDKIDKIDDPVSKLVAIGFIIKYYSDNEGILNIAVEISSRNGWRKPLIVYLEKLKSFYEAKQDQEKARKIQQRIQLINH